MSDTLVFGMEGLDSVLQGFQLLPARIDRARRRTLRKATRQARRELIERLATAHGIPQKALKDRRRVQISTTKEGLIWIGYAPIAAIHLGKPVQTRTGVRVRQRVYPGAFVATMASGHTGVFQRKGVARFPIIELQEPLPRSVSVVAAVRLSLAERLPGWFEAELRRELDAG